MDIRAPTAQFDNVINALAWLVGHRFMHKSPMHHWLLDLRIWVDNDLTFLSLPIALDKWAVALLTAADEQTTEFLSVMDAHFCDDRPTFANWRGI